MKFTECSACLSPKVKYECKLCQAAICKSCAQFVDEDRALFLDQESKSRLSGIYCGNCMVEKITPELDTYDQLVAAAEQVLVFTTDQTKESRLFKRTEKALTVENCTDCKEATALLSFLATKAGFNCLVDVEFSYDKRRDGSYKIIKWSGSGIPTHADLKKYNR